MELNDITLHIEVLIFASEKPLSTTDLAALINNRFELLEEQCFTPEQIKVVLDNIIAKYSDEQYPFEARESGGGWQFLTKKKFHQTVGHINGDKFLKRLSIAAMESLAIIAYQQPVSKGEIESLRGVNSDYSVQKLLEKDLIQIVGRNDNMPGRPLLYGTSRHFMDYFGLNSTEDLPKINEVLAEQLVEGSVWQKAIENTEVTPIATMNIQETPAATVVSESGDIAGRFFIQKNNGQDDIHGN